MGGSGRLRHSECCFHTDRSSASKPVIAALTLRLAELGAFGPRGLDRTVDSFLTPLEIAELTTGTDPSRPMCPGETYVHNRLTGQFEWSTFECPDLSRVNLRDLMRGNHGMYDFINEYLRPDGTSPYWRTVYAEIYEFFGWEPLEPIRSGDGIDYLKSFGLKRNVRAVIGGTGFEDWEMSFGNTILR